jgi:RHS repeat-associated protein
MNANSSTSECGCVSASSNDLNSKLQRLLGLSYIPCEKRRKCSPLSVALLVVFILFSALLPGPAIADDQHCWGFLNPTCGQDANNPLENRCYPQIENLSVTVSDVTEIGGGQKRLGFCIRYSGTGFHEASGAEFGVFVHTRQDDWVPETIYRGTSTSNYLNPATFQCVTLSKSFSWADTINSASRVLKFWAVAVQDIYVTDCQCECDTLYVDAQNAVPGTEATTYPLAAERGPIACQGQIADPINATNGNMYISRVDVRLSSDRGLPIEFGRHYNSFTDDTTSLMKYNWRHSFEYSLARNETTGDVILTEATGKVTAFRKHVLTDATQSPAVVRISYESPYGSRERLAVDTTNGVYTVIRGDESRLVFNGLGQLDRIEDMAGNQITLHYSGNVLDSVVNASGRSLHFEYTSGVLSSVRNSAGQQLVSYQYNPTRNVLTRATNSDGSWENYDYGSHPYDQRGIVDITTSDGKASHYDYDTLGLASGYNLADGKERVDIEWQQFGGGCGDSITLQAIIHNRAATGEVKSAWSPDRSQRTVSERLDSDCGACATQYQYDGTGMKQNVVYADGRRDSIVYDARGNLLSQTLAKGSTVEEQTVFRYDSSFNLPTQIAVASVAKAGDSSKRNLTYDSHGNLLSVVESGWSNASTSYVHSTNLTYNVPGQITKLDGPRVDVGDTIKYVYYGSTGDLRYVIQANSDTTEIGPLDLLGNRTWVRSPNGDTTRYSFDVKGQLTRITMLSGMADSTVTSYSYTVDGKLTSEISPKGGTTSTQYTGAGYVERITNALGQYIQYATDSAGNPTSESVYSSGGALRKQESYSWDNKHQMTHRAGLYGDLDSLAYSPVGTVDSIWGPGGHHATYYFDQLRQVDSIIQRNGAERIKSRYTNDTRGNVTRFTDPDGFNYVFAYDDKNRLIYDSNAISGVTKYGYDQADNLAWKRNSAGDTTKYVYDALNRLTKIAFADSLNIYYRFDSVGFPNWRGHLNQDSTSAVFTKYRYDLKGRLIQETRKFASDTATYSTLYHYDKNDNLDTLTYPSGRKVVYAYDTSDNVIKVSANSGGQWLTLVDSVSYAPFGEAESWKLGNGIWVHTGLDSSYRLDSVSTFPDPSVRLRYTLESTGNVSQVTNLAQSTLNRQYWYDAVDRLTKVRGLDSPDTVRMYSYGFNGNRWRQINYGATKDTLTSEFENNRVRRISKIALYFAYDAMGNVIRTIEGEDQSSPPPDPGGEDLNSVVIGGGVEANSIPGPPVPDTITYQYNKSGTLKSIDNGSAASYYYDAWLRRVKKTASGTWTKFIPSASGQPLAEYWNGGVQRDHVYLNGQSIARLSSISGETVLYAINDPSGTPIKYLNGSKTTVWSGRWYPFGEIYNETVSAQNFLRFPGQWRDFESGLYNNWHRYYSPRIGRYYQADPIGLDGGVNLYGYAAGNPLRFIDPDGLDSDQGFWYDLAQAAIGLGDAGSFGITKWIRQQSWYGGDCFTREDYWAYGAGEIAAAVMPMPFGKGRIAANALKGQLHHAISKKIFRALEETPGLSGLYRYRDRRFAARAFDLASHRGYETWHRELDVQIAEWIRAKVRVTPAQFERYLETRYLKSDLRARFPLGL